MHDFWRKIQNVGPFSSGFSGKIRRKPLHHLVYVFMLWIFFQKAFVFSGSIFTSPLSWRKKWHTPCETRYNGTFKGLKNAEFLLVKVNYFLYIHLEVSLVSTIDLRSKFWNCLKKFDFNIEHFDFNTWKRLTKDTKSIANWPLTILRRFQKMTYKNVNVTMPRLATVHHGATGQNAMAIVNRPENVMRMILLKKLRIEPVLNFVFTM